MNLVAEIERRLTGRSASPGLASAEVLPQGSTYVLVLFDGLGDHQLAHPAAALFRAARRTALDAPFPSTTTVALATVATGVSPRQHGLIGHLVWFPDLERVVNTLKWVDLGGRPVAYPTVELLPHPNLWERLAAAGVESITIQPAEFADTPLTRALYRGCRFEGVDTVEDAVEATVVASRQPGRFVFTYFPQVDYAAHVWGQKSSEYDRALRMVVDAWMGITTRAAPHVVVCGTADHGLVDYGEDAKTVVRDPTFDDLILYGDPRAVMANGPMLLIRALVEQVGARLVAGETAAMLWGDGPAHPGFEQRRPRAVLLAPAGRLILPRGFDKRLVGYHGGLEPEERRIPLLVR